MKPDPIPPRYKLRAIKSKITTAHRVDKTKQIHRDVLYVDTIPKSTKMAFKASCANKGETGESMRDAIIRLMRFYVAQNGILPGQEEGD